jgi:tRNA threonylcarbamoyladenosine biosynthesis protein TsaE
MPKQDKRQFVSESPDETRAFAQTLAQNIVHVSMSRTHAYVIALEGDLGTGKTTFVQGFAKGLGVRETVSSPTFVVAKKFQVSAPDFQQFFHVDMYRLGQGEDVEKLGLGDVFANPSHLVIVEWPWRVAEMLPKGAVWIKMAHGKKDNERVIAVGN